MATVRVYRYELYDPASRSFVRQAHHATVHAITRKGGIVMYSTARVVEECEVGADGELASPPAPAEQRRNELA